MISSLQRVMTCIAGVGLLVTSGCAPAVVVDVPEFHGRVVNAQSQPVSNATIQLTDVYNGQLVATLTSGANGDFNQPERSHLTIYIAGGDPILQEYSAVAVLGNERSHAERVVASLRLWWNSADREHNYIGMLKLQ